MNFNNKVVLITGAGSGIGRSMAILFAQHGAKVAALDLNLTDAKETATAITDNAGDAIAIACDVASASSVDAAFYDAIRAFGTVDILINNAGIAHVGNIEHTDETDLDRLYEVNIKGVYNCSRRAITSMLMEQGGVILNMASIASKVGISDRFAYSMSKGAVLSMTLSIAKDYVKKGIRCNCICPARIHTPFVDGFLKKNYPDNVAEMFEQLSEYQPIGRMGSPEEVAKLALFLCSDDADFITGAAYDIDGGVTNLR